MSDYTTTEIIQALGASDGHSEKLGQLDWLGEVILRGESVRVENVAEKGGEGEGEDIWFVVKIGDQLFKKSGYYASHYGTDWDGPFSEVKPTQRMVTFYEAA